MSDEQPATPANAFRVAIITLSKRVAKGLREDLGGDAVATAVTAEGMQVVYRKVIADDKDQLAWELQRLCDFSSIDIVFTTGGTGISRDDVTPDATLAVIEKRLVGMEYAMFQLGLQKTPYAMLSRAVAGTRNKTLIINLPGSPTGAVENLTAVLPALAHAVRVLQQTQVTDDEHIPPSPGH